MKERVLGKGEAAKFYEKVLRMDFISWCSTTAKLLHNLYTFFVMLPFLTLLAFLNHLPVQLHALVQQDTKSVETLPWDRNSISQPVFRNLKCKGGFAAWQI